MLDRHVWSRRFAAELVRLGTEADARLLRSLGADLYETLPGLAPEFAARAQFEQWGAASLD